MKYQLIESLGLEVVPECNSDWVSADALERALANAPVVYGGKIPATGLMQYDEQPGTQDTHIARLVCVQAIQKDTAESLLRELIECPAWEGPFKSLQERARKLLEEKIK